MARRKWDAKTKALIVIEGLKGKPVAESCTEHQDQSVPNGIKLSSNTPLINKLRASHGDRVAVSRIGSALNGAG